MKKEVFLLVCSLALVVGAKAQFYEPGDTLLLKGQLSGWGNYNPGNEASVQTGIRYIPQVNYELRFPERRQFDFELSANAYGIANWKSTHEVETNGDLKPYRAWARYSGKQFEVRLGLQKINFGPAQMLRPLMWFDRIDPRDPLQLTDGVWGILGRYYFLNNANVWIWGLYGNQETKGWEVLGTRSKVPEWGGRLQLPLFTGEIGLSYHHREAESVDNELFLPAYSGISEHRMGVDLRMDYTLGMWLEASWVYKEKDLGMFTHQELANAGLDYTFALGNGLGATVEHLFAAYDNEAFRFEESLNFTALSLSYPFGLFDSVSAILYYDHDHQQIYSFVNWKRQYNKVSIHLMAYSNPKNYNLPTQGNMQNFFAGEGVQLLFVYNH